MFRLKAQLVLHKIFHPRDKAEIVEIGADGYKQKTVMITPHQR